MRHTSAELKRLAREQLNGRWGLAIGANLLVQMIVSGLLTPFYFLLIITGRGAIQYITYMVAGIIISAVSMVLQCGILRMYLGFARNQEESIVYKNLLKKSNVEVISISEPIPDGFIGELVQRIFEWMDEYYSIRLSGEVLRGMKEKAQQAGYQMVPPL